uniref:hypothetical protein n=1 Tax=Aliarcobacter sp. TaxID=2321116 RepID=UPI0040474472
MKNVRLIEIDDNNNSNIFDDVNFEMVSVTTKEGDTVFEDALFAQMAEGVHIVLDAGGGNDAKSVISMLHEKNEIDNFIFIIPIGNSRAQIHNAKDTFELINSPSNCIFVLNQVHDIEDLKNEFLFFFGNSELNIEPAFDIKKIRYAAIKYSPVFELAAMRGKTISQLSEMAKKLEGMDIKSLFFEQSKGDKELFKSLYSQYKQSVMAKKYLEELMPSLEKEFKDIKNICVAQTKGGVGKSTLSSHIFSYILENN